MIMNKMKTKYDALPSRNKKKYVKVKHGPIQKYRKSKKPISSNISKNNTKDNKGKILKKSKSKRKSKYGIKQLKIRIKQYVIEIGKLKKNDPEFSNKKKKYISRIHKIKKKINRLKRKGNIMKHAVLDKSNLYLKQYETDINLNKNVLTDQNKTMRWSMIEQRYMYTGYKFSSLAGEPFCFAIFLLLLCLLYIGTVEYGARLNPAYATIWLASCMLTIIVWLNIGERIKCYLLSLIFSYKLHKLI